MEGTFTLLALGAISEVAQLRWSRSPLYFHVVDALHDDRGSLIEHLEQAGGKDVPVLTSISGYICRLILWCHDIQDQAQEESCYYDDRCERQAGLIGQRPPKDVLQDSQPEPKGIWSWRSSHSRSESLSIVSKVAMLTLVEAFVVALFASQSLGWCRVHIPAPLLWWMHQ